MITLQRPDPKVNALLGENKSVKDGDLIKPSQFAVPFLINGKPVVFNTFTRQCIETELYELFPSLNEEPSNIHFDSTDREMSALVQADFLVKADRDEAKRYEDILAILRRMQKKHDGYTSYTILPTTACNARCVYCFEESMIPESMSVEVIEQTFKYIKLTRRKGSPVRLHWFGGEPMVGEATIDCICSMLRDEDIPYSSSMISNGSLITAERAKKLKEDWHLGQVQITLDGREDVYCERKRYVNFNGSPYRAVLDGIHELIKHNVRVSIRLNVEEDNLREMYALADELEEEFADEKGIRIYSHSIFLQEGSTAVRDDEAFYDELDRLEAKLKTFNIKRVGRNDQAPSDIDNITIEEDIDEEDRASESYYDKVGHLKRYFCMADNPTAGPVIMPNGKCHICEHISETPIVGDIFEEQMIDRVRIVERKRLEDECCRKCPFLPTCTDYSGCPVKNRDCKREMLISERRPTETLAKEPKLPPILLSVNGEKILVKEPTREFAERYTDITIPNYYKADSVIEMDEFDESVKKETI